MGVFLSSLMMWITISIDWPSLITLFLLGLLPHFGFPAVFRGAFGNVTVAFLLFTFVLVYPLSKTFFVRRCAVAFVTNRFARKGPWCFVSFLLFSVTFMGLFISPSVLFVAFMPFLEDIYEVLQIKKKSQTGNMLMLGTAFCISLSSGMTAIGHVWPTLAIGYYKAAAGIEVNQFQYMAVGIPTGLVLVLSLIAVFRYIYRPSDLAQMDLRKAMELKTLVPKTSRREVMILAVMALTVILWVGPSLLRGVSPWLYKSLSRYTTAMPPLLGCILLFILRENGEPLLSFKEAVSNGILWAAILMTGAATMLGSALTNQEMGIKEWLSTMLGPVAASLPAEGIILFFFAWCILETNFSSNIVTTTGGQCRGPFGPAGPAAGNGGRWCRRLPHWVWSWDLQHDACRSVDHQYRGHQLGLDNGSGYVYLGRYLFPSGPSGDGLCWLSLGRPHHWLVKKL